MSFRKTILSTLLIGIGVLAASAQEQTVDSSRLQWRVAATMRVAHVFPASDFFKGMNARDANLSTTWSPHLQMAFRFAPNSQMRKLYPHAYQGIGVGLHRFPYSGKRYRSAYIEPWYEEPNIHGKHELGNPVSVYLFQGSRIASLSERLSLDYEWNFGAAFGWNPYDEDDNYYNNVVGSRVNAYMNLAFMLNYRLSRHWNLTAGIDLAHFSNGNTSYPNKGVNTMGARLSVAYDVSPQPAQQAEIHPTIGQRWQWDIMAYGAKRCYAFLIDDVPCILPEKYWVLGLSVGPLYQFSKYLSAGTSMDLQYDEGANMKHHFAYFDTDDNPRFYRPPFREQFTIGLSLHAEFRMNIFAINVGLGHSLLGHYEQSGFYQTLSLKTFFTPNVYLNTGYRLHDMKDPNNLMIGLGARF